MIKHCLLNTFACSLLLTAASCLMAAAERQVVDPPKRMPFTTNSENARRAFLGGLENIENHQIQRAHNDFRNAVHADPDFALAHLFLSYDNGDRSEEITEIQMSQALAWNASKPERLMIQWLGGWRTGQMVPAIEALNDLTSAYPQDKFLLFIAGRWMVQQRNYEAAEKLLQRATEIDPEYPAALSELAYAYAYSHSYYLAFEALDKYVALMPGEPNTEDSYGAISLMAGEYSKALFHFHKALSYDPTFIRSQAGIARVYMMMGNEMRARKEYAKAILAAPTVGDRVEWKIQNAMTYFFGGQHELGAAEMSRVAKEAHSAHLGRHEAMCYRLMSEYDLRTERFLQHSQEAQQVLESSGDISSDGRDQELAILMFVRAVRAASAEHLEIANDALQRLASLAAGSRDNVVQQTNEGAIGGVLWVQKKYSAAIPHLEEDQINPLSAARLLIAYRATGDFGGAERLSRSLDVYHEATIEDLLARELVGSNLSVSRATVNLSEVSRRAHP